jgi:hypothetical protein
MSMFAAAAGLTTGRTGVTGTTIGDACATWTGAAAGLGAGTAAALCVDVVLGSIPHSLGMLHFVQVLWRMTATRYSLVLSPRHRRHRHRRRLGCCHHPTT